MYYKHTMYVKCLEPSPARISMLYVLAIFTLFTQRGIDTFPASRARLQTGKFDALFSVLTYHVMNGDCARGIYPGRQ